MEWIRGRAELITMKRFIAVLVAVLSVTIVGVAPASADAPPAPAPTIALNAAQNGVDVSWAAVVATPPVTDYVVTLTNSGGTTTVAAPGTTASFAPLAPGAYSVSVVAVNGDPLGDSPPGTDGPVTVPVPPAGPNPFTASATATGTTTADISWTNAGGNPAATYTVTATPPGGSFNVTGLTATATGLAASTAYTFTVTATNATGNETATATATTDDPAPVPPGPFTVTATATGPTSVDVAWTNAGGTPAATYVVTATGGTVSQGPGRTATVTGLTPNTAYVFTVTADNPAPGVVVRTASATTDEPDPVAPGPFAVAATAASSTTIDVSWGNAGGDPAATYAVSISPNDGTITNGPGRTATVTGLEPSTRYTVTVVASNAGGDVTERDRATTLDPDPIAPTAFTVSATAPDANSVDLSWTNAGGTPAATYAITVDPDAGTITNGAGRTARVTGLTSGITYTFTVTATNAAGSTSDSATARPAGGPAAPARPTVTAVSDTELSVSWTAPDNNGSVISGYEINVVRNSKGEARPTVAPSPTNATVGGLVPGGTYIVQVIAVSNLGNSESSFSTAVTLFDTPGQPTGVNSARDAVVVNSATVSWTPPADDGGSPLTGHVVTLTPDNGGDVIVFQVGDPTITSQDVGGLTPGTYEVKVQGENAFGLGDAGNGGDIFIPDIPGLLRSIVAENTTPFGNTVEVSWEPPTETGGLPIDGYRVTMAGQSANVGPTASFARIGPLPAGFYEATIQAFGPAGDGPVLTSNQIEVRGIPPFNSADAFINQQYRDFLGRPADDAGRQFWASRTAADGSNMDDIVISFMRSPEFSPRRSVVRLYQAYFRRLPDPAGFDFWSQRLASGQGNLEEVSQFFASGDEFNATYGSLTNAEFVDLVYQNVLGRPGEASGRAYWIGQLDAGLNRGRLMTLFSESPEFIGTSGPSVDVVVTYRGLLDRLPDDEGFAFWRNQIANDPNALSTLVQQFLGSEEYGERVTP